MRTLLLLISVMLGLTVHSQNLEGKYYNIKPQAELYVIEEWQYVNFSMNTSSLVVTRDFSQRIITQPHAFKVIKEFSQNNIEYVIIRFLQFTNIGTDISIRGITSQKNKHYILRKSHLTNTNLFEPIPSRWNLGTLTVPFKFRINPGAVEINPNISTVAQFRLGKLRPICRKFSLLAGLGLGTVSVNSNLQEGDPASSKGVLTFLTGASMRLGETIDFFVTVGFDRQLNPPAQGWRYENDAWIGVGLGFDLFKITASTTSDTQK